MGRVSEHPGQATTVRSVRVMNKQGLVAHLQRLQEATEEILRDLEPGQVKGRINWGHLYCADSRLVLARDGDMWFQVVVREASPEALELRRYVHDELAKRGWKDVFAVTEW